MKLQSMTDFLLEQENKHRLIISHGAFKFCKIATNYAKFLKQPLTLGMFIPCDEDDKPLEYPIDMYYRPDYGCQKFPQECYLQDKEDYYLSEENVLFEGFEIVKKLNTVDGYPIYRFEYNSEILNIRFNKNIESLLYLNLTLTPNAIKNLGL